MNITRLNHKLGKAGVRQPDTIVKRDGSLVPFDISRIGRALEKCYSDLGRLPDEGVESLVARAVRAISERYADPLQPTVENVQDIVELTLIGSGEIDAARAYMEYRTRHAEERANRVPAEVREAFERDKQYFPTPIQQFQFMDKYSRFDHEKGRRETWVETVDRTVDFLKWLSATAPNGQQVSDATFADIHEAILTHEVMPSMRLLAMAGPAAQRNSLAIYNCSYIAVNDLAAFHEALLISMAGCGVGFSVERKNIDQLPHIPRQSGKTLPTHFVADTTEGWAEAIEIGIRTWFSGDDIEFDYSLVRPAGSILLTKGGRASGPAPLKKALDFARKTIISRQRGFLRPIDAHDIMCEIGNAAVAGGVRRTAMISLFDWDDEEMRNAKAGAFWEKNPQRGNANNSAVWPENITQQDIMRQMLEMDQSGGGEPGIFSRPNAVSTMPVRRKEADFGTNPCGEIILRDMGLCNLSSAIGRPTDTVERLFEKIELATIIGTIQSLGTTFPGMRPGWKQNCEDERLLGVDMNGQQDCPAFQDPTVMANMKTHVINVNRRLAEKMGINQAASTTTGKPNGNSSQKVNCSSGMHWRWAPYYLRRVRIGVHSPIFKVLRAAGVKMDPEVGQQPQDATTWVVSFPIKSPEGIRTRKDVSAVEQLEYWLMVKTNYVEHNQSATVTYLPDELIDVTKWVADHKDKIGGLTFLPADQTQYELAPYEEITQEQYEEALAAWPDVDFSLVFKYEKEDMTTASQELSCFAGSCEV